jgi:hypothetical protein
MSVRSIEERSSSGNAELLGGGDRDAPAVEDALLHQVLDERLAALERLAVGRLDLRLGKQLIPDQPRGEA